MVYSILNIPMVYTGKGNDYMGILWIALEKLTVSPEPTKELIKETGKVLNGKDKGVTQSSHIIYLPCCIYLPSRIIC